MFQELVLDDRGVELGDIQLALTVVPGITGEESSGGSEYSEDVTGGCRAGGWRRDRGAGVLWVGAAPALITAYPSGMRGLLVVCLIVGCYRSRPREQAAPPVEQTQPLVVEQPTPKAPPRDGELYALDEALADVLSGPLVHVGTGPWFGLFRINACAYRNDRVFVVNIYCTTKEMKAFSIVVLSPSRGRAVIYAEAEQPISTLERAGYFTFKAETQPPPDTLPTLSLDWRYDQLTAWDEKRYYKWVPGCFGGVEIKRPQGGCLKALEHKAAAWKERNQPFLDSPPADWYRIVREMRARAKRDGKHVSNPGG